MVIRTLTADDAERYRAFRLRGLREHPDAFRSSFEDESHKDIVTTRERLVAGNFLGAFDQDGQLVGAIGLLLEAGLKTRHISQVIGMYVIAEHVGQGVGRSLLQALIDQARNTDGIEQLLLTVTASNTRAKQIYESVGFEVFGVEPRAIKVGAQYFDKAHMILFL